MNIYFSCSITGGRRDQPEYAAIVRHLLDGGHHVPTSGLSDEAVLGEEAVIEPRQVYARDVRWVEECDVLVAEVSTPSHGVGYEIALGLMLGKPVLCCYKHGARVSKMLTGNTHAGMTLAEYHAAPDLLSQIDAFLARCSAS